MRRGIRLVLYNADEAASTSLRSALLSLDGVRIVAEVDEPVLIPQVVQQVDTEVLLVHLDPDPEAVLPVAGEVARANPDLAVIAVSESNDGQLILSAMRMGIREFLTRPLDPEEVGNALDNVITSRHDRNVQGTLITVVGSSGGAGASSLAANLAVELAETVEGGVALVDLDYRFGQIGTLLDVEPRYTIADLCASPEQLETQVIERALLRHATGVNVLCRPLQFAEADNITAAHCVGVLTGLTGFHEYVVVDGPNRFDVGAKAVFDLTDLNLLVTQLLVPCVRSTVRMLTGMREAGYNLERTRVILNRVGREPSSLTVADAESALGVPVFATVPEDWATMSDAANMGEPLLLRASKSKVRLALADLAKRLHNPGSEESENNDGARKGRSLLSKIFSEA